MILTLKKHNMKKSILVLIILFLGINNELCAQWNSAGDNYSTGELSIGSQTPNSYSKLIIKGPNTPLGIGSKRDLSFEFAAAGKAQIRAFRGGAWDTYMHFLTTPSTGGTPLTRMSINENGKVGIGTTNPDEKLTVKGKIHAEEVRVDLSVPPDYVFQKYYTGVSILKESYKMLTLEEVEEFTKKNHHLPEVPSAKQIQKEGLNLKQMTALLLQKVEELTLYTIEQEKRIKVLEKNKK